jgi:Squalene-hopene cyclase C-terminal domain
VEISFVHTCMQYLQGAQNEDGGWGFHLRSQSRVEPTVWALLALTECQAVAVNEQLIERGLSFLQSRQLPDGSWPAAPGSTEGAWVTSLACWALRGDDRFSANSSRGLIWLCRELPGEAPIWRRFLRRLGGSRRIAAQNDAYYGWSWTPGTASWVEPTSYALIVLSLSYSRVLPESVARRKQLGEAMLYDRICPGGGWNSGNPIVYGVPGEPQVSTTVWALIALREHTSRPETHKSLLWLERSWKQIKSPESLALADIALSIYGRRKPDISDLLRTLSENSEFRWNIPAIAWSALALVGTRNWLKGSSV